MFTSIRPQVSIAPFQIKQLKTEINKVRLPSAVQRGHSNSIYKTLSIRTTASIKNKQTIMANSTNTITVKKIDVSNEQQLEAFKNMTMAYLDWLAEDLCFQGIDDELSGLPGVYAKEKGGTMLLAYTDNNKEPKCIGAVALRALQGKQTEGLEIVEDVPVTSIAEMKRLFVLPEYHGKGVGQALALAVLEEASQLGYKGMVLDTLERLTGANTLYKRLGFQPCQPYNYCPLPGVLYWIKHL